MSKLENYEAKVQAGGSMKMPESPGRCSTGEADGDRGFNKCPYYARGVTKYGGTL